MAQRSVGDYLNLHFVSSFQKVGTFRIRGGNKQGGNVASYFCTPKGQVLHLIAGPVNGNELLREARWVMETCKLAALEGVTENEKLQMLFREAHMERLVREHRINRLRLLLPPVVKETNAASIDAKVFDRPRGQRRWTNPGKVHKLLASYPLVRIGRIYNLVFEEILNEDISTRPVAKN